MKRNFRNLIALMLTATLTMSLGACGQLQNETPENVKTPANTDVQVDTETSVQGEKKNVKISYMVSQADYNEAYQTVAKKIKEEHGYEVEFQVVPDGEFKNLLQVKLATSEAPDVFETTAPNENETYNAYENCVDLSNEDWVSRLVTQDVIKDKTDGKIYAMPMQSASGFMGVFYNKQILADCGIENPHPTTYAEFLKILETIKQKGGGVTPIYMTNGDTWTTQIFMTAGYPVSLNEQAEEVYAKLLRNELKWTDVPEVKMVLDRYKELYDLGYVNEDAISATYDTAADKIATGEAAMYLNVEGFANDLAAKYPDCELGSFVIPFNDVDKMAVGSYVKGLYVPKAGKQVDETLEFLNIWSQPEYRNLYHESQPGFSAFGDVDGGEVPESVAYLVDNYVNTDKYVYENNSYMTVASSLSPDLWSYYNEMVAGMKTSDEVLESYQRIYEDYMHQLGQPGF